MKRCNYEEECKHYVRKCPCFDGIGCSLRLRLEQRDISKAREEVLDMYPIFMNDCGLAHVPDRFRAMPQEREI